MGVSTAHHANSSSSQQVQQLLMAPSSLRSYIFESSLFGKVKLLVITLAERPVVEKLDLANNKISTEVRPPAGLQPAAVNAYSWFMLVDEEDCY